MTPHVTPIGSVKVLFASHGLQWDTISRCDNAVQRDAGSATLHDPVHRADSSQLFRLVRSRRTHGWAMHLSGDKEAGGVQTCTEWDTWSKPARDPNRAGGECVHPEALSQTAASCASALGCSVGPDRPRGVCQVCPLHCGTGAEDYSLQMSDEDAVIQGMIHLLQCDDLEVQAMAGALLWHMCTNGTGMPRPRGSAVGCMSGTPCLPPGAPPRSVSMSGTRPLPSRPGLQRQRGRGALPYDAAPPENNPNQKAWPRSRVAPAPDVLSLLPSRMRAT